MKIEQLQQENEYLKAQIKGLTFSLEQANNKIRQYEGQVENLYKQNLSLQAEMKHLNMLVITSNANRNDSRNY